jgi:hypothetical protein
LPTVPHRSSAVLGARIGAVEDQHPDSIGLTRRGLTVANRHAADAVVQDEPAERREDGARRRRSSRPPSAVPASPGGGDRTSAPAPQCRGALRRAIYGDPHRRAAFRHPDREHAGLTVVRPGDGVVGAMGQRQGAFAPRVVNRGREQQGLLVVIGVEVGVGSGRIREQQAGLGTPSASSALAGSATVIGPRRSR